MAVYRVDGRLYACVAGEDDDGHQVRHLAYLAKERHAVHRLHAQIRHGYVYAAGLYDFKRRRPIARCLHSVAVRLKQALQKQKRTRLVVNDEYGGHAPILYQYGGVLTSAHILSINALWIPS